MDASMLINRKGIAQVLSPSELLTAFESYLRYNKEEGLIWEYVTHKTKEGIITSQIPKRAPLSTPAFCLYAGISHRTFMAYLSKSDPRHEAYGDVAEYIKQSCAVDMFNGSAVGMFNGNLTAAIIKRDFGIQDEEDANDPSKVHKIQHEVIFTNYEDVTQTPEMPHLALPPTPTETSYVAAEEVNVQQPKPLQVGEYGNLPNTHSSQMDQEEYYQRNGYPADLDL